MGNSTTDEIDRAVRRDTMHKEVSKILDRGNRTFLYRKTNPMVERLIDYIELALAQDHQRIRVALLAKLTKRQLIEPVTKREVNDNGTPVGIDLDADKKGSLVFIQDNGFNMAIDQATKAIEAVLGEAK